MKSFKAVVVSASLCLFLSTSFSQVSIRVGAEKIHIKETAKAFSDSGEKKEFLPKAEETVRRDVCKEESVDCGPGRQCSENAKGEPTCICIEKCSSHHQKSVCGSNGKTYPSHCHLHQAACIEEIKLSIEYSGQCKEKPKETSVEKLAETEDQSPLVCLEEEREILRNYLIEWLKSEEVPDGWFFGGKSYHKILEEYFQAFDFGHDSEMDSNEFLLLAGTNNTMDFSNDTDEAEKPLLKALCIDALIDSSDDDHDWKLTFKEFVKCLDPNFQPPHKSCSLEDKDYKDGEKTKVKCNICVCACGNWVCTSNECEEITKEKRPEFQIVEEEEYFDEDDEEVMTENEWEEYIRQLYVKDGEKSDEIVPNEKEKEYYQEENQKHIMKKEFDSFEKKEDGLENKKELEVETKPYISEINLEEKEVKKKNFEKRTEEQVKLSEKLLDKGHELNTETNVKVKYLKGTDVEELKIDKKYLENSKKDAEKEKAHKISPDTTKPIKPA